MIATGNPGCMLQIALGARERGMSIDVMHPVQILDEAYCAGGLYTGLQGDAEQRKRTLLAAIGLGLLLGVLWLRGRRQPRHGPFRTGNNG